MNSAGRRLEILHLGCGRQYRPGQVNVDAHDPTAADVLAQALRLPFGGRTFRRVESYHLVEHFGWGTIPYLLGECFRVLRPGGALVLETPDPGASFRRYLESRDAPDREAQLAWILGRPSPGYAHRWLLDRLDLESALRAAGFEGIRFEEPQTHRYAPGLRATAGRPDSPHYEMIAHLRRAVPLAWLADPDEAREIEARVFAPIRSVDRPEGEAFLRRLREIAILSVRLAARWAHLSVRLGLWPRDRGEVLARYLAGLERAQLPALLEEAFARLCRRTNTVPDGYDFLLRQALDAAGDPLRATDAVPSQSLADALRIPPRAPSRGEAGADLRFTRASLERRVVRWRDRAVRLMALGRLRDAEILLERAFNAKLRYFYTAWNLAVLRTRQGDLATAAAYYDVALRFENPGPEAALRRALALCLLALGDRARARDEIRRLPEGPVRRELSALLQRRDLGENVSLPPPPTEPIPAGKEIWWSSRPSRRRDT